MDDNQGDKPVSLKARIIGGSAVIAAVAALVTGVTVQAHAAQVTVDAQKALAAAAPAYEGAITLGGNLDDLTVKSVQAKQAYDAEQERLAAEKAAQEAAAAAAAAQAAAEAAAQAAADEAARQAAGQQQAADDGLSSGGGPASSDPVKCPAGTHANAVDGNGNESACEEDGPNGEQCQAYDANNNCTNWYKP